MGGWVSVDTMHLSVKYPRADVYKRWARFSDGVEYSRLRQGVIARDCVVRNGASGYKVSVWKGDARAFLTDHVEEAGGDSGMGIWLQLGPKFLLEHGESVIVGVHGFLRVLGVVGDWPIRVTRLDLAIDLPGVEMGEQGLDEWRKGWVGRSKVSSMFFDSRTSQLQTVNVGARGSAVFLRIYDKVAQAEKEGDLDYWRSVWDGYTGPVCRVEWETRPSKGGFEGIADFDQYGGAELIALAQYLVRWGRLCDPSSVESNNRRWQGSALWRQVEQVVLEWCEGDGRIAERRGKEFKGVSEKYVRFLSGAISGGMARLRPNGPSLGGLVEGLEEQGQPLRAIERKAEAKADLQRLL